MTGAGHEDGVVAQARLYGAPLGDTVRAVTATLGISQAAVARTLGISAPMLSQLVSGQRVKLGNPQAVQRLQSLVDLVEDVREGLAHHDVGSRLEAIQREDAPTLSRPRAAADEGPQAVRRVLRGVASGQEIAAAADVLEREGYADLATVLRAYGGEDPTAAARHHRELSLRLGEAPSG